MKKIILFFIVVLLGRQGDAQEIKRYGETTQDFFINQNKNTSLDYSFKSSSPKEEALGILRDNIAGKQEKDVSSDFKLSNTKTNSQFYQWPTTCGDTTCIWHIKVKITVTVMGVVVFSNRLVSENNNPKGPLFPNIGTATGIGTMISATNRLKFLIEGTYNTGKVNKSKVETFAKSLVNAPYTAKSTIKKGNWSNVSVLGGPMYSITDVHKTPVFLVAQAGVAFNTSPNTIVIDRYDGQTKTGTVYNKTENKTSFVWQAKAMIPIIKLGKKSSVLFTAGYGNLGGLVGFNAVL